MSSPTEITVSQLSRLIGTPGGPIIVDVRTDEDFDADPRLIPSSFRHPFNDVAVLSPRLHGAKAVIVCQRGLKLSQGAAALLRVHGVDAETLEGGTNAWREAGEPMIPAAKIPSRDAEGRTVWVTRQRPKIDRVACPWLIRRFVDYGALFLYVAPSEVAMVAERFDATPFDVEGVFWSHRGERCSFDTMLGEFGLETEALTRLATIVRGPTRTATTSRPKRRGCLLHPSASRACIATTSSRWRPGCCSTTPSTAGHATASRRRMTGRRAWCEAELSVVDRFGIIGGPPCGLSRRDRHMAGDERARRRRGPGGNAGAPDLLSSGPLFVSSPARYLSPRVSVS